MSRESERPRIYLTWQEQVFAAQVGTMRQISAIRRERPHYPHGEPKSDLWGTHIEAAGAEFAVAKYIQHYWQAVVPDPEKLPGDVGPVQVRSTWRPDGRLIVHQVKDKNEAPFVLVRGVFPEYELAGWILGRDAKNAKYYFRGDGRADFFVPADDLIPMEQLQAFVRKWYEDLELAAREERGKLPPGSGV